MRRKPKPFIEIDDATRDMIKEDTEKIMLMTSKIKPMDLKEKL